MMARRVVGFAGAVAAEKRDGFALADFEVDAMEYVAFAVPGMEPADVEQGRRHSWSVPYRLRGRRASALTSA